MKSGSCTVSLRACLGGTHLQFESIFSCSGYFDIHTFFFPVGPTRGGLSLRFYDHATSIPNVITPH